MEGNAISLSQQYHDFKLMKEAGINWVRLAHYQQDDYVLQLCDELGILVEEEIPWVNKTPKVAGFEQDLHSMMTDLMVKIIVKYHCRISH